MGKLIIFEGLDGSGKGTQTKLTADHLRQRGADLRQITFPNYESNSSALVKMYLAGEFGEHPDDVNAYAASSFYAVDRFASYKTDWGEFYREGGLVLSDRYTTSNAVHQCSKLPPALWAGNASSAPSRWPRTVKSVGCARLKASMMRSSRNWKRSFKLRAKELRGKGRSLCCGSPPQKILPH